MENKNIYDINFKKLTVLLFLAILPNLLGAINLTLFGIKIHFFQIGIFLSASLFGPWGGLFAGGFGSIYSAVLMSNPYILVGNMILGLFAGLFARKMHLALAVLLAFSIQIPYIWITDVYLMNMPSIVVKGIIMALLISNLIWALTAGYVVKSFK